MIIKKLTSFSFLRFRICSSFFIFFLLLHFLLLTFALVSLFIFSHLFFLFVLANCFQSLVAACLYFLSVISVICGRVFFFPLFFPCGLRARGSSGRAGEVMPPPLALCLRCRELELFPASNFAPREENCVVIFLRSYSSYKPLVKFPARKCFVSLPGKGREGRDGGGGWMSWGMDEG